MEFVNSQGIVAWVMTNAQMEQAVRETQADINLGDGPSPESAGPNILLRYAPGGSSSSVVVVISGDTGQVLGRGTAPNSDGQIVASPSGTEWAWNIDLGTTASGHDHGEIELAGLGVPVHTLFDWTAPTGYSDQVNYWTDAGIILQRISNNAYCIDYYAIGNAAFIVNPLTGTITNLFSGNDQFLYATKEVHVSGFYANTDGVYIRGASYPGGIYSEGGSEVVVGADPSPDGVHVVVNREGYNFDGTCNVVPAKDYVELINGATQSHLDVASIWESGWLSNVGFIASKQNATWLYNLQGKPQELLANSSWLFVGVVSG
jgi:hypothetical protein